MNIVATGAGEFVELQATSERVPFGDEGLTRMLELGRLGIKQLIDVQKRALGEE